ncbi:hypothetical protein FJY63_06295 [Candidatus Sumerlaeota bacterium]|nr:hypothetical protein [Candidatus Sumerlaeota bacterium]
MKNDKYLEAMERQLPLASPGEHIQNSLERIRLWQTEGLELARRVRPQNEEVSRKHKEIPPMLAAIRPHVENKVSANASQLITGEDDAWQQAASEYWPMMGIISKSLSPGFTTAAVRRRRKIASVLPDMSPKVEPTRRTSRKKGGAK